MKSFHQQNPIKKQSTTSKGLQAGNDPSKRPQTSVLRSSGLRSEVKKQKVQRCRKTAPRKAEQNTQETDDFYIEQTSTLFSIRRVAPPRNMLVLICSLDLPRGPCGSIL